MESGLDPNYSATRSPIAIRNIIHNMNFCFTCIDTFSSVHIPSNIFYPLLGMKIGRILRNKNHKDAGYKNSDSKDRKFHSEITFMS